MDDRDEIRAFLSSRRRFAFLDPRAHDFWIVWDRAADDSFAMLRTTAGRDPYDKALSDLVGELGRHPRHRHPATRP